MGIDVSEVYVLSPVQDATTGAVQLAPVGTPCPTGAREKLSSPWASDLGYIGEDGLTVSGLINAGDALRDWAKKKIRTLDGEAEPTISIPVIQMDATLAEVMVGKSNVTTAAATKDAGNIVKIAWDGKPGPNKAWCCSMKDEDRRVRVFVPDAQVTECDDVSFVPGSANTYSLTLSLNADESGHYIYFIYDDGKVAAA